jgi:hypothetical protein
MRGERLLRSYTLVKVLAPEVNSVNVTGDALQSGAQVTLEGLFSARHRPSPYVPRAFLGCNRSKNAFLNV